MLLAPLCRASVSLRPAPQPQENLVPVSLGRTGLPVTPRRSGQSSGTQGRPQCWGREGWLAMGHGARLRMGDKLGSVEDQGMRTEDPLAQACERPLGKFSRGN